MQTTDVIEDARNRGIARAGRHSADIDWPQITAALREASGAESVSGDRAQYAFGRRDERGTRGPAGLATNGIEQTFLNRVARVCTS
jgi:hypothetical protein